MFGYAITLGTSRDFLAEEIVSIAQHFARNCDACLLVEERGASGKLHLHASTKQKQKTANLVTLALTRLYEKLKIPCQKGVAIKVKKTTDEIGWFHYLTKDMEDGQQPVLIFGWEMTWIQDQCRDNLKKIPHKMMKGNDYTLNMAIATNVVLQYAKRTGIPLSGKDGFKTCICRMAEEGYLFHSVKFKVLYAQVLARTGDTRPMQSLLDLELCGLE